VPAPKSVAAAPKSKETYTKGGLKVTRRTLNEPAKTKTPPKAKRSNKRKKR
jgi:hypothetical protein